MLGKAYDRWCSSIGSHKWNPPRREHLCNLFGQSAGRDMGNVSLVSQGRDQLISAKRRVFRDALGLFGERRKEQQPPGIERRAAFRWDAHRLNSASRTDDDWLLAAQHR